MDIGWNFLVKFSSSSNEKIIIYLMEKWLSSEKHYLSNKDTMGFVRKCNSI